LKSRLEELPVIHEGDAGWHRRWGYSASRQRARLRSEAGPRDSRSSWPGLARARSSQERRSYRSLRRHETRSRRNRDNSRFAFASFRVAYSIAECEISTPSAVPSGTRAARMQLPHPTPRAMSGRRPGRATDTAYSYLSRCSLRVSAPVAPSSLPGRGAQACQDQSSSAIHYCPVK